MAFTNLDTGTLEVGNPILGSALNAPKKVWEPGTLAAHKGHFGQGALLTPFTASLVAGPSATAPFSYNATGLSNHAGVHNNVGSHVKVGSNLSLGALEASYNAISQKITGLFSKVTPGVKETTPKSSNVAAKGGLYGFWNYNGRPLDLLHFHSDIRLKKNIKRIEDSASLSKVMQLNPVYYDWKENTPSSLRQNYPEGRQIGLIAQEVQKYIPEVVKTEPLYDKEYKGIDYGRLVTVLIGAVQEQQKEITELKEKVAALEAS
jgi:hypothetical protein